jgi:probable rRNA maturation factor
VSRAEVDVTINGGTFTEVPCELLERAVVVTLHEAGVRTAEVSLTLLGDEGIRDLNARYLGEDRPTDVIAFSLGTSGEVLGDIYVGHDQAARQAQELGVDLREELVRLAVHGTLHILGHDHPGGDERDSSPMFRRQEALVRTLLEGRHPG